MYVLIDNNTGLSYVSKCLRPLSLIVGYSTQTLRNWLKQADIALKHGYIVKVAKVLKSKQGVNNGNLPHKVVY